MGNLFGYLPDCLDNEFIRQGHNRYGKDPDVAKAREGVKSARAAVGAAKKAAFEKEHPVIAAKRGTRGSVREAVKSTREAGGDVRAARAEAAQKRRDVIGAAQRSPESAGMERFERAQGRRSRKAGKLEARAKRLRGGMVVSE